MIEVDNLTKYFGPTRSIEDLSFSVGKGDVLGFLGPNGAGKSTTMRILVGLSRPTRGTARINGHDTHHDHHKVRRLLGYLPENAPLYGDMTLAGYLEFMAGIKGLDRRGARREMERTTDLVNLAKERPRLLRNLSKGTRQRAALAQALIGDPPILILDEPTVGLDPSQINEVRELIRSMKGQRTIVLSTHILPEVELTCTRIVILSEGRIVASGSPEELLRGGDTPFEIEAGGSREDAMKALRAAGMEKRATVTDKDGRVSIRITPPPAVAERGELARKLVEAGLNLMEFREGRAQLEDVFLKFTGRDRRGK